MLRASADLQIYLLGDVQIEYQGKLLPFPRRESLLRLFARLILTAGKPQSRKKLAFSLWPDVDEASALANLRRHLHLIRQFLPEEARSILQISTQEVRWVDDPLYWVDVFAFEHTCADPRAQAQAAELYRGELLSGVDDDEVILARRDELHRLYVSLLKKLSEAALLSGQPETAVHWSRKLLQADPWDEESLRLNMTARAQSGNRQAALETYQNFARDLSRELDAQPMPETMTLYSDILHNRLARPAPPQKVAAPLFVSRSDELAQLQGLFHNLVNGQGRVVFISGQAGVGKTTLLQEALRRFLEGGRDDAPRVLWGSCPPPVLDAPARPYAPWRQILNAAAPLLARSEDISPEWLNRLLPLVPDLALLRPGLLIATQPNAAEMRAALRQAFHALALFKPLVLILEDIHWADDDSLDVLQELAETCQSLPLLILSTHRLDEVPLRLLQAKRAMRQRRCVLEILLMAFSDEEVRQFLDAMLGGQAVSPALYDEIAHYAQGLPLLLREAAESVSRAHDRRPTLPSLRDTIALRLEQLNERAHQMLEAAAVLGFSFPDRELALLLDWPESQYRAVLDYLQTNRFVLEAFLPGSAEYTFSHQLIHQIILASIPSQRAIRLHEQAARALQQAHLNDSGYAVHIAAHYQAAGLPLPAARFWLEHARESTDLAAFEQALQAIDHALGLLDTDNSRESRELRAQAALQRGVVAHYRGQASDALPLLEEALRQCGEFPALRANALSRLAYALYTIDRFNEAWQFASESLQIARTLGDTSSLIRALNILGMAALMLGRTAEAIQYLREALVREEAASAVSVQTVQSLNHLGTALVFAQNYVEAEDVLTKTVALARRGGLIRLEAAALTMQGQVALNRGQYAQAVGHYQQAIAVAGESYLPGMWGKFAGCGAACLRMGRLDDAQIDFARGLEIATRVESRYGQLLMRVYLAFTSLAAGRAPADSLSALENESAALNLHAVVMLAGLYRARLLRLMGDFAHAAEAHQRAIQSAQASDVPHFQQNAQLEWLFTQAFYGVGDRAALDLLSIQAQTSGEVPQQVLANLTLAATLHSESRPAEAFTAAHEALALARSCPDQILTGEALILLVRLHESLAHPQEAQSCRVQLRMLAETAFAPFHLALDTSCDPALRQIISAAVT